MRVPAAAGDAPGCRGSGPRCSAGRRGRNPPSSSARPSRATCPELGSCRHGLDVEIAERGLRQRRAAEARRRCRRREHLADANDGEQPRSRDEQRRDQGRTSRPPSSSGCCASLVPCDRDRPRSNRSRGTASRRSRARASTTRIGSSPARCGSSARAGRTARRRRRSRSRLRGRGSNGRSGRASPRVSSSAAERARRSRSVALARVSAGEIRLDEVAGHALDATTPAARRKRQNV